MPFPDNCRKRAIMARYILNAALKLAKQEGNFMKLIRIAAALAAGFGAVQFAPAAAQDYQALQRSSLDLYSTCLSAGGAEANSAICACIAGYFGGAMSDREYDIVARLGKIGTLIESGAAQPVINAELVAFFAAGYTQGDADAVSAKMEAVTARGDVICAPYANSATT